MKRRDLAGQQLMPWADVTCTRCGRVLKSERSQERRLGPTCRKKKSAYAAGDGDGPAADSRAPLGHTDHRPLTTNH